MNRRFLEHGDLGLQPDVIVLNQVLSAWGSCRDSNKSVEAAKKLNEMKKTLDYDESSYSHVLRACAWSDIDDNSRKVAVEVAHRTWDALQEETELQNTSYMYAYYLQACKYMKNADQREDKATAAFLLCQKDGLVNKQVLAELQKVVSPALYEKMHISLNTNSAQTNRQDSRERHRGNQPDLQTKWEANNSPDPQT